MKKFRFLGGNTMNKLSQFNSFVLLSKQEIIASFNEYSDFFISGRGRDDLTDIELKSFINLSEKFKLQLRSRSIETINKPWEFYEYNIVEDGLNLSKFRMDPSELVMSDEGIEEADFELMDDIFTVKADLFSVDEFANIHDVTTTTVRQWIRRGKIKNAKKFGNIWKIPSITDKPSRGFYSATYYFDELSPTTIEKYEYLKNSRTIHILNDFDQKDSNIIKIHTKNGVLTKIMNVKEREKFELTLISDSNVHTDDIDSKFRYGISKSDIYETPFLKQYNDFDSETDLLIAVTSEREIIEYIDLEYKYEYTDFFPTTNFILRTDKDDDITMIEYGSSISKLEDHTNILGSISITLILNREMQENNINVFYAADGISGDLLEIVSELYDTTGPLNEEYGEPLNNVIIINQIFVNEQYMNGEIKERIITTVPKIVWKYFLMEPEVIVYLKNCNQTNDEEVYINSGLQLLNNGQVYYAYIND